MPVRAALRAAERGASGPRAAQASEGSAEPGTEVLFGYFSSNSTFRNFIYKNVQIHYSILYDCRIRKNLNVRQN